VKKILWELSGKDIKEVKEFVKQHHKNKFVQTRIKKNLAKSKSRITKSVFWWNLVSCLVTTQQRSGPNSFVNKL